MVRVEHADDVVVWRRSRVAKAIWGVVLCTYAVSILAIDNLDIDLRVFSLLLVGVGTARVWARVWRPHLAATADGLVVRRALDAVMVPWHNVAAVEIQGIWGVVIRVRAGEHVTSAVPVHGPIQYVLDLDSEAGRATRYIEERARRHAETRDDAETRRSGPDYAAE